MAGLQSEPGSDTKTTFSPLSYWMPVFLREEKRRRQPSLGCPFSPGQRQGQFSQAGQGAILPPPVLAPPQRHHRSGRECRQGSRMPLCWPQARPLGAPQNTAREQGWPLSPGSEPSLPDVLLHLILILRLFYLKTNSKAVLAPGPKSPADPESPVVHTVPCTTPGSATHI